MPDNTQTPTIVAEIRATLALAVPLAAANVAQIMEMQPICTCLRARLDPNPPEIRSPQPSPFGANEEQTSLPRLGETFHVPANLRNDLRGHGHRATTSP